VTSQITEQEPKKGGLYTEKERLERQKQVYHMRFEKGYSAVRIADELGVSRNTINSDIHRCYSDIVEEFPKREFTFLLLDQIQALRLQKARIVKYIHDKKMDDKKLNCEKQIFPIDAKIADLVVKFYGTATGYGTNIFTSDRYLPN
jgi:predicted DNA-binding protein YlxM (UPF0122 family)